MVFDIGDETINITAKVADGVKVISPPMGNDWGYIQVNKQFSKMLERIVRDPGFSCFLSSGDQIWHRAVLNKLLYHNFEQQKCIFGDGKMYGEMGVDLPSDIMKFYGPEKIKHEAERIDGVEFDYDDTLYIKSKVVEEILFGPPVNRIIECMITVLDDFDCLDPLDRLDRHIDTIYLIGNFGRCKFLHQKLGTAIRGNIRATSCCIIVPSSPEFAIAKGAVMWRKNPAAMKPHRLDATYGIVPFNAKERDSQHRFYDDD